MKVEYSQSVRVELGPNPSVADIEGAIAAMRVEASDKLKADWEESVSVIGSAGITHGGYIPSLIFRAFPTSHSKEGEQG